MVVYHWLFAPLFPPQHTQVLHNVAHQGRGPMDDLRLLEVPEHYRELFRCLSGFVCGLGSGPRLLEVLGALPRALQALVVVGRLLQRCRCPFRVCSRVGG